eukprot:Nitzschia sp. Nitz4//scaffold125_size66327//881//1378//NITZ4_006122-RA/size66327-snap-gene-0.1-mRNA-1//1//CDS//3329534586//9210//frame0
MWPATHPSEELDDEADEHTPSEPICGPGLVHGSGQPPPAAAAPHAMPRNVEGGSTPHSLHGNHHLLEQPSIDATGGSTTATTTSFPVKKNIQEAKDLAFPFRLYDMLEDAERLGFDHIVSWGASFTNEVLPKYFAESNYLSFQACHMIAQTTLY